MSPAQDAPRPSGATRARAQAGERPPSTAQLLGFSGGGFSPRRLALYVPLFLLGAVTGVAGSLLQAAWFPGGLLLALVAAVAGWMAAVILLTTTRPEGDFVFAAGGGSYLFLLGGMALAVICATLWRPGPGDG
ncbi:hypothetical protein CLM85_01760 [Streptomyces albidoflavus]|uniref:DUF6113 family protein n=1 Tax=Streptomyces albidoflavus TaxID=1886 RepID=UPI000BAE191C|nr:DUF6113 family protein [Streptomyces albidoflavus]PAX89775.1 hypothetical protein CLM82_19230 [Streptomyces albidoflavus]PBO25871.1 hypothetical protein CLM85_01760 [Streptomyces albidoflavus]